MSKSKRKKAALSHRPYKPHFKHSYSLRESALQPQEQYRQNKQREHCRRYHTADNNPRHAHTRLRACAQRKRRWQHPHHHRQRRHKDRLQARLACFYNRRLRRHAFMHQRQRIVKQQRAVLSYKTVHNQNADEGIQIYRIMRQQQAENRTDYTQRQRKHADERRKHRFIKHCQQQINQKQRQR